MGRRAVWVMLLLVSCATPVPQARLAPEQLKGMKQADIVALLGEPDFRRNEPPAELWQYRAADCVLDLFFDRGADGLRVSAAATRGRADTVVCSDADSPLKTHRAGARL
jgi:hypothetical protein